MYYVILSIFCLLVVKSFGQGQDLKEIPNKCLLDRDVGPCMAYLERYYFNSKTKKCEKFIYGGCHGNENRFLTEQQCLNACLPSPMVAKVSKPKKSCLSKPDPGSCRASIERYYYNSTTRKCEKFVYGGCGGNKNNFKTASDCKKKCT